MRKSFHLVRLLFLLFFFFYFENDNKYTNHPHVHVHFVELMLFVDLRTNVDRKRSDKYHSNLAVSINIKIIFSYDNRRTCLCKRRKTNIPQIYYSLCFRNLLCHEKKTGKKNTKSPVERLQPQLNRLQSVMQRGRVCLKNE